MRRTRAHCPLSARKSYRKRIANRGFAKSVSHISSRPTAKTSRICCVCIHPAESYGIGSSFIDGAVNEIKHIVSLRLLIKVFRYAPVIPRSIRRWWSPSSRYVTAHFQFAHYIFIFSLVISAQKRKRFFISLTFSRTVRPSMHRSTVLYLIIKSSYHISLKCQPHKVSVCRGTPRNNICGGGRSNFMSFG